MLVFVSDLKWNNTGDNEKKRWKTNPGHLKWKENKHFHFRMQNDRFIFSCSKFEARFIKVGTNYGPRM